MGRNRANQNESGEVFDAEALIAQRVAELRERVYGVPAASPAPVTAQRPLRTVAALDAAHVTEHPELGPYDEPVRFRASEDAPYDAVESAEDGTLSAHNPAAHAIETMALGADVPRPTTPPVAVVPTIDDVVEPLTSRIGGTVTSHVDASLAELTGQIGTRLDGSIGDLAGEIGTRLDSTVGDLADRLDSSVGERTGELQTHLDDSFADLTERFEQYIGDVVQAISETQAEIAGALGETQQLVVSGTELHGEAADATLEGLTRLVARTSDLQHLLKADIQALRTQLDRSETGPRVAQLASAIGDLEEGIASLARSQGDLMSGLLDRIDAGARRTDGRLDSAMAELTGSLTGALETLQRRAIADGTALRNGVERVLAELPRTIVPRIQEALGAAQQQGDVRIGELEDTIARRLASEREQIEAAVGRTDERIDRAADELAGEVGAVVEELRTELGTQLRSAVADITAVLREDIAQLHGSISRELDYNRLQHVRDVELLIDAMDAGWRSIAARVEQSDEAVLDLRAKVLAWFDALDAD